MKKKSGSNAKKYPHKPEDVPVNQAMLYGVRDELKSDIKSLEARMDSRFHGIDAKLHRLGILMEEQNSKNNVVLDGLSGLFQRQDRLEGQFTDFQKIISVIK